MLGIETLYSKTPQESWADISSNGEAKVTILAAGFGDLGDSMEKAGQT
jgi:hypothetical protein